MSLRFLKRRQRVNPLLFVGIICLFFIAGIVLWFTFGVDQKISITEDKVKLHLLNHQTGEVLEIGLEEYVVGVVAAEMPVSFPIEALKAQAVAARTYAVKRLQVPDPRVKNVNSEADLSTDSTINQAWINTTEMKKRWGKWNYAKNKSKIVQAVEETRGTVLVYKEQLIDPVYHASCGGKGTENSGEVWKFSVPYLQGVSCTGHTDRHQATVMTFDFQKIDTLLGTDLSSLPVSKIQKSRDILQSEKSATGRVKTLTVHGKEISGTELRSKLGLPSTRFTWKVGEKGIEFETNGYGHGVGMCQYGAAALAEEGKNCEGILKHYYTGGQLAHLK